MKTKILFLFIFLSSLNYAQTPIDSYFGSNQAMYDIVDTDIPLNQTNSGANLVWNFDSFARIGQSEDTFSTPTASEVLDYPKTTTILTINSTNNSSKIYFSNIANAVSITSLKNADLELNYKSDIPFVIRTLVLKGGAQTTIDLTGINPSSKWGKIYYNFGGFPTKFQNSTFKFIISAELPADKTQGKVLIDNFKIIHFN